MRTLTLRHSGLTLSRIIAGGWQAGRDLWVGIDDDESIAALRAAFEGGVTTFDTAEDYGAGHAERILGGVIRALKASVGVLVILFILNLAFAMVATILFAKTAPEYFGNPLISLYSLFKVFTIEGWFEIPDTLARRDIDPGMIFLLRAFFVVAVTVGGLLGLSMANAVFVDEMTADNTDLVEEKIDSLRQDLHRLGEQSSGEREDTLRELIGRMERLEDLLQEMRSNGKQS